MATRSISLTVTYTAWDTSANAPKTGDAANHTLRWVKDGTAGVPTNSPTEDADGEYKLVLTAAEADCTFGVLRGSSSTSDVVIIPVKIAFERSAVEAGSTLATLTIQDSDTNPIGNCKVWITTDSAGANLVAGPKWTNDSGQVAFYLDAGTIYYVWRDHPNYSFVNPKTHAAS